MRATGAARLATAHRLLTKMDLRVIFSFERSRPVKLSPGQDQETTKVVLVEIFDRVEQVAVKGHQCSVPQILVALFERQATRPRRAGRTVS
jgi:hypothetical protein